MIKLTINYSIEKPREGTFESLLYNIFGRTYDIVTDINLYKRILFVASIVSINAASIFALQHYGYLTVGSPNIVVVKNIVPEEKPVRPLDVIIADNANKYKIPASVVKTIIEKESTNNPNAINFEPNAFPEAQKRTKNLALQRLYASSHGYMQVLGLNTIGLKVQWSELYDPEHNIDIGCHILRDCLDRHKEKTPKSRLFQALICYNGAEVYAQDIIKRLEQKYISQVANGVTDIKPETKPLTEVDIKK